MDYAKGGRTVNDVKDFDSLIDELAASVETLRQKGSAFQEAVEAKCRPLRAECETLKNNLTQSAEEIKALHQQLEACQAEREVLRGRLRDLCRGLRGLLTDAASAEERNA